MLTEKIELTKRSCSTKLDSNEVHLGSVTFLGMNQSKMFGFFGPTTYIANYVRYYVHLTSKRLILEDVTTTGVRTDTAEGKVADECVDIAMDLLLENDHKPQIFGKAPEINYDPAKGLIKTDRHMFIPYTCIESVEVVKQLGIPAYMTIKISDTKDAIGFILDPFSDHYKVDLSQFYEFVRDYLQNLKENVKSMDCC
ncbi:MAG TPA: hypothetical protein PKN70_13485 [Smithellaceae bacterium]|nr:hypothetical protein [Smithellaceae bacterium]